MKKKPIVAAVVGVDGSGKSSTFIGTLKALADHVQVVGIGDQLLHSGPGESISELTGVPLSRSAKFLGRFAKGLRWQRLYKNFKLVELAERAHICQYVSDHNPPDVILTDGQPLINVSGWACARFYREALSGDDEELWRVICYLSGEDRIPLWGLPRYILRAWQLPLVNLLGLSRFSPPDLIFLLDIDPEVAMERIRARGRPLQVHETADFLGKLGRDYGRVCTLLHERRAVEFTTIRANQLSLREVVEIITAGVLHHLVGENPVKGPNSQQHAPIEVIATTMSGSIQDQRKVQRIGPAFSSRTSRPVRMHRADSHAQAREITQCLVAEDSRIIVSAGGAGTFNAVVEGCHLAGRVPSDLRLGFLRKGSADLIGKALGIPDQLEAAVEAILAALETGNCVPADILTVEATDADGGVQRRKIVGFGGLGVFGEVPRFTESRFIKVYKGVLGSLLGDLGPFFVGLSLAIGRWQLLRVLGRVPEMSLILGEETTAAVIWGSVLVVNGDLGADLPLGRGLSLGSGSFRVIAMRYLGLPQALRQILAARKGAILSRPEHYGCIIRTVDSLRVQPRDPRPYAVNVDGGTIVARGEVSISVSGKIWLLSGIDQDSRN
jgi:diacylglycerol kinase family enzyme/thymidylate kinase